MFDSLWTFPPLHLGDVRKLRDKAVTSLMLLMLLHLNREGRPGADVIYKFYHVRLGMWDANVVVLIYPP